MPDIHEPDRRDDHGVTGAEQGAAQRVGRAEQRAAALERRHGRRAATAATAALAEAAMAAHARADYGEALTRWAELRAQSPGDVTGFIWGILSAKAAGSEDLARQLAEQGGARLPAMAETLRRAAASPAWEKADEAWRAAVGPGKIDRKAMVEAALAPLQEESLSKKLRRELVLGRLKLVQQAYPRAEKAHAIAVNIMHELGQWEAAARLAEECIVKFPDSRGIALAHVELLDKLKRYAEAHAAISAFRDRAAPDPSVEVAYIQALSRLDQLEAAEAACASAVAAFPDNAPLAREYATMATRAGNWDEAMSRWLAAEARWPDRIDIKRGLEALRLLLVDRAPPPPVEELDETGALFSRFESLGATTVGCEFGIVQRHFGAPGLGLLRWTAIPVDGLCDGLRSGFAGLGELDNVIITTYRSPAGRDEYLVSDRKYGFSSHTLIEAKDAPADKVKVQTARRLTFLAGKLMEDVQAATKIFVYKFSGKAPVQDVHSLFRTLRGLGDVTLLCVEPADAQNEAGSVRQLEDRLFMGYMSRFMVHMPETIDYAGWKDLCSALLARGGALA